MAIRTITDEQIQWAIDQYVNHGKTSTWIASQLQMNDETIRKWLKRSSVVMRESRESLAASVNEGFFEVIDTEIKAYWLGFLLADGCIGKSAGDRRSLRFYVSKKDKWVIETFSKDIEYKGKIRIDLSRGQYGVCFNSKKFCGHLIRMGYLSWKENGSCAIFEYISDDLFSHFVRGFFDGDGCISYQKRKGRKIGLSFFITIAGHKDHLIPLQTLSDKISSVVGMSQKVAKIRSTCCTIGWNGNKQVARLGDWLYANATRFLKRKHERFLSLNHHRDAFDFDKLSIKVVDKDIYSPFLDQHHYLGCGGRNGYTLGLYIDGLLIGAAMIGSITRAEMATKQSLSSSVVRELARFCIHPEYHFKNIPTWFLSRLVKRYKQENPDIKLLISFADSTHGHDGTIYKAANWIFDGFTHGSYHYVGLDGVQIHKKTVYGSAKRGGLTERQYVEKEKLVKVSHKKKRRFLMWL